MYKYGKKKESKVSYYLAVIDEVEEILVRDEQMSEPEALSKDETTPPYLDPKSLLEYSYLF